jgi:4-alpha-glucanotransferase
MTPMTPLDSPNLLNRSSGVLLHPTSLPGPHGSGDVGETSFHFVDWLTSAGQKLWQVLPLGGIGPGNSPYMSSSAFAGNVLLIDLKDLQQRGWLETVELTPNQAFDSGTVNFAQVVPWRMSKLALAAQRFTHKASVDERRDFAEFKKEQTWLTDYALFMTLTEIYHHRDWNTWPSAIANRQPHALEEIHKANAQRIHFWEFSQWCFFRQWHKLRQYANSKGVKIVGDAPIFIAFQSAEVWARPELFELDSNSNPSVIAGVPPDFFSATGQRWGNPLYRWAAHQAENYAWWIERIRHTLTLVDIVRIDHFRGFVDYWEIPATEPTAINGRWAKGPGIALFEALRIALGDLPLIAEDLGIITEDVEQLRQQLRFPGMRILHFAFGGDSRNAYLPHNYEANTVAYTGTHDNNTTQGWWREASQHERDHVKQYLDVRDETDIHWKMIAATSASVAASAIHPMQDVLGLNGDCRMNLPGVGEGYWAWRFTWDQVLPAHAQRLLQLAQLYGR